MNTTHHAAMMTSEIVIAVPIVIPNDSQPRIRTRQTTNGMQLPMYPQAYPRAETLCMLWREDTSTSIES